VVDELRAGGTVVAVLTNGTDTIPAELRALGIADRFDAVFNSAEIGAAKPEAEAFQHVCRALGVPPEQVFFTDDSPSKLSGAVALGMDARLYVGLPTFVRHLEELGFR
jgi:putative hydrolase of the HAD superfamily